MSTPTFQLFLMEEIIFASGSVHIDERLYYADRMKMVEQVAKETDEELSCYILEAITEGISYDHLKARTGIPCCKDVYYDLYRRFFWLLSKERQ